MFDFDIFGLAKLAAYHLNNFELLRSLQVLKFVAIPTLRQHNKLLASLYASSLISYDPLTTDLKGG